MRGVALLSLLSVVWLSVWCAAATAQTAAHGYSDTHGPWNRQREVDLMKGNHVNNEFLDVLESSKNREKNVVIPIFSNVAWVDNTINLVKRFKMFGMNKGYFVYAWDSETCEVFSSQESDVRCFYNSSSTESFDKNDQVWGTPEYFAMIDQRLSVIQWIHDKTDISTFMVDTDVTVMGNLFDYVKPDLYDLQYQEEIPSIQYDAEIPTLNGGCWFAKNAPIVKEWLSLSINFMVHLNKPDQDAMNYALKQMRSRLRFSAFPKELFPNGFYHYIAGSTQKSSPSRREAPVFVHSNWISGHNGKYCRIYDDGGWSIGRKDYTSRASPRPKLVFKYGSGRSEKGVVRAPKFASLKQQMDRVKKLVHVALKFGGSISLVRLDCHPEDSEPGCGIDLLFDFNLLEKHITVLPDTVDLSIAKHVNVDLNAKKLKVPPLPSAPPSSSLKKEGVREEQEQEEEEEEEEETVVWIRDPEDMTYEKMAQKHPLSEEANQTFYEMLSVSGLVWNDVLNSLDRFKGEPYVCIFDDQDRKNTWHMINTITTDLYPRDSSDYRVYWVDSDSYSKPRDMYRMYTFMRVWDHEIFSGWSLLWYGMRELEGHVLPSYIQSYVCKFADRVYINVNNEKRNWFAEAVCTGRTEEQYPCLYV